MRRSAIRVTRAARTTVQASWPPLPSSLIFLKNVCVSASVHCPISAPPPTFRRIIRSALLRGVRRNCWPCWRPAVTGTLSAQKRHTAVGTGASAMAAGVLKSTASRALDQNGCGGDACTMRKRGICTNSRGHFADMTPRAPCSTADIPRVKTCAAQGPRTRADTKFHTSSEANRAKTCRGHRGHEPAADVPRGAADTHGRSRTLQRHPWVTLRSRPHPYPRQPGRSPRDASKASASHDARAAQRCAACWRSS